MKTESSGANSFLQDFRSPG